MAANTGYKGISYHVEDGERVGYNVFVQWNYRVRCTTVRWVSHGSTSGALNKALRIRAEFERELRKPRSERQITTAGSGIRVVTEHRQVVASLGKRKSRSFGYRRIGRAAALAKARQARREAGFP